LSPAAPAGSAAQSSSASTAIYSASTAVIEQRLTVVLEVAEQALDGHPNRSTQRVL
jgi:hypothetical protein